MDLITYTLHALTVRLSTHAEAPTLSLGRGSKTPIPLLPREKGLGDEGVQGVKSFANSLSYLIHDSYLKTMLPTKDPALELLGLLVLQPLCHHPYWLVG